MKLICSVALALAILIQPTSSRADVVISGAGSVSCGKIAEDYRKLPTDIENLDDALGARIYEWREHKPMD
jgi:hypothetical protein